MHFNRVKNGWWPWEREASERRGWCIGLLGLVVVPITVSVPRTGRPASTGSRLQRVKTKENDDPGHRTDLYMLWLAIVTWKGAWDGGAETETLSIIVTYRHKQGSVYKRECWVPKHLRENFRLLSTWNLKISDYCPHEWWAMTISSWVKKIAPCATLVFPQCPTKE